jgi:hypothetical protein
MKLPGVAGLIKEACASVQRNAESEIEEIFDRFKVREQVRSAVGCHMQLPMRPSSMPASKVTFSQL